MLDYKLMQMLLRPVAELFDFAASVWHSNPAYLILGIMFMYHSVLWLFLRSVKKRFSPENCTTIMITGGAMGLGKLLAEQFVRRNPLNSVSIVVVDIRADLESQLKKDIRTIAGDITFKNVHFYAANLADKEQT